jgi:hypothetical protein
MPDTSLIQIVPDAWLLPFGVPAGWLAMSTVVVIGVINTIKTLTGNWIEPRWFPFLAATVSVVYARVQLAPDWGATIAGALALFLMQWVSWIGMKRGAARMGARDA